MQLIIHTVNMGSVGSKRKKRLNKDIDKKHLCKLGLTMRRGDTNVEGCLKTEYHGKQEKSICLLKTNYQPLRRSPITLP